MENLQKLYESLDDLWARYLDLVDEYERSQKSTQNRLASGFFSLAQAQARAPIGRRYGSECYDNRMKATVRVRIAQSGDDRSIVKHDLFVVTEDSLSPSEPAESGTENPPGNDMTGVNLPTQQPSPPATPLSSANDNDVDLDGNTSAPGSEEETTATNLRKDPICWFGILIPPSLRTAQISFKTAVYGSGDSQPIETSSYATTHSNASLIHSLEAASQMRAVEKDIRKLRKGIKTAEKDLSARCTVART